MAASRPANLGRPAIPVALEAPYTDHHDVGQTQHPKTDIDVPVVWMVVVAGGGAGVGWIIVPGTAAHHAGHVSGNPTAHVCVTIMVNNRENRKKIERRYRGVIREQSISISVFSGTALSYSMGDKHNTRKPTLLPLTTGWLLSRAAERT